MDPVSEAFGIAAEGPLPIPKSPPAEHTGNASDPAVTDAIVPNGLPEPNYLAIGSVSAGDDEAFVRLVDLHMVSDQGFIDAKIGHVFCEGTATGTATAGCPGPAWPATRWASVSAASG